MYKLLLATDNPAIQNAFSVVPWESLGFRPPRVATSAEAAIATLNGTYADAVAIGLPTAQDDALVQYLLAAHPLLPIMTVSPNAGQVETYARELGRLLARIHADVTNEAFTEADRLQVCRHDFFRMLMAGQVETEDDVLRKLRLLRSKMDPHKPCVMARLSMPEDSDFLKGRWQYGPERLEMALRNIFGVEVQGLRILSCVLPGEKIVLLGCPMLFHESAEEESMTGVVSEHVQSCIAHVGEYLGLDLSITAIRVLSALTALARSAESGELL